MPRFGWIATGICNYFSGGHKTLQPQDRVRRGTTVERVALVLWEGFRPLNAAEELTAGNPRTNVFRASLQQLWKHVFYHTFWSGAMW